MKKPKKPKLSQMTSQEYVEECGDKCPFCHGKNINVLDTWADIGGMSREVECHDCGKLWTENFVLCGYEENT